MIKTEDVIDKLEIVQQQTKEKDACSNIYKLVVNNEVVFEYNFLPTTDEQIALGLLYSIDNKLDKMPVVELQRILNEKDYVIIDE